MARQVRVFPLFGAQIQLVSVSRLYLAQRAAVNERSKSGRKRFGCSLECKIVFSLAPHLRAHIQADLGPKEEVWPTTLGQQRAGQRSGGDEWAA